MIKDKIDTQKGFYRAFVSRNNKEIYSAISTHIALGLKHAEGRAYVRSLKGQITQIRRYLKRSLSSPYHTGAVYADGGSVPKYKGSSRFAFPKTTRLEVHWVRWKGKTYAMLFVARMRCTDTLYRPDFVSIVTPHYKSAYILFRSRLENRRREKEKERVNALLGEHPLPDRFVGLGRYIVPSCAPFLCCALALDARGRTTPLLGTPVGWFAITNRRHGFPLSPYPTHVLDFLSQFLGPVSRKDCRSWNTFQRFVVQAVIEGKLTPLR